MFKGFIQALIVLAVGAFLFMQFGADAKPQQLSLSGSTMGTSWNVQLVSTKNSSSLQVLAQDISHLLERLDKQIFSTYSATSEISRLNQAEPGTAMALSVDMLKVLQVAQQVYTASDHAFDITIAPLVNLWGFGPVALTQELPGPSAIDAARSLLGMEALIVDAQAATLIKKRAVQLDMSGIAKGYAVDKLAELLMAQGEENFLVEIGGELRVQGWRADQQAWTLAIEKPQAGSRTAFTSLYSQGGSLAVAGSGNYRNYREVAGKRYAHEIDPRTGYPVQHQLAAVTVIAASAMQADAWATALMVLGVEAGTIKANSLHLDAYFIMHNADAPEPEQAAGKLSVQANVQDDGLSGTYTSGFAAYLEAPKPGNK